MVKTRQHTSRVTPWQMIAAEPIDHAFKQCILGEIYSHPGSKGGEAERPTFLSERPLRISLRNAYARRSSTRAPGEELQDVLDDLGQPDAVTLDQVANRASLLQPSFAEWLRDTKVNARRIPHRFEDCGYVAVRNPNDSEGRWKIEGKRHTIYGKASLTERERIDAAFKLAGSR